MITSSEQQDQVGTSTPDPRFDVATPSDNPLVASLPIVVTKVNDKVKVYWDKESGAHSSYPNVESVFEQLSNQAKRDTLKFPTSARAHANFGAALAKAERWDEAITELEVALNIEPNDFLAGVTLARVHVNKGDYERAKGLYEDLLRRYPGRDSILLSLTFLALRINDYTTAEEHLHKVLELSNAAAFPYFLLGITRLQRRNPSGAIAALKNATHIEVRRAEFHHALGVAYAMVGDFSRAERAFRTALVLSPDTDSTIHALSSVLLEQGHLTTALEVLRPHLELHPNDPNGLELLGRTYFEMGKFVRARAQFAAFLDEVGRSITPEENARFLTNIGASFLGEGNNDSAEAEFKRAIALAPHWSAIPYENIARIRARTEEWNKVADILKHTKQLFPAQQSTRRFLALAYAMQNSYLLAIAELQPLFDQGTADAETCSTLGNFYERTGNYDSALRLLKQAHTQAPRAAGIINNLAYTHLMAGQVDAARSVLASLPKSLEPHPELVATQGLLRLWEGDRVQGKSLYTKAEHLASIAGNRKLAKRIRQKMYLELAKDSSRRGDTVSAHAEVTRGLSLELDTYWSYKPELEELLKRLTVTDARM